MANEKSLKRCDFDYKVSDHLICVKWMDNRLVLLLFNFISQEENIIFRRRKTSLSKKTDVKFPLMIEKNYKLGVGVRPTGESV